MSNLDTPAMRRVLAVIEANPGLDGHAIAQRAHVSYWTFKNHCRPKLIEAKKIHISGWKTNTYSWPWPLFTIGPGKEAKRPENAKQRHSTRMKEWRERTAYNEARKAARRLAKPDPVVAALMGIAA